MFKFNGLRILPLLNNNIWLKIIILYVLSAIKFYFLYLRSIRSATLVISSQKLYLSIFVITSVISLIWYIIVESYKFIGGYFPVLKVFCFLVGM